MGGPVVSLARVEGPALGMNTAPGLARPGQMEFAANVDISRGRWDRRPGFRPWLGTPYAPIAPAAFPQFSYIDALVQFTPTGGGSRWIALGEDATTNAPAVYRVEAQIVGGQVRLFWSAVNIAAVDASAVGFPGRWSFCETTHGELVAATGSGRIVVLRVPAQAAGAFAIDHSYEVESVPFRAIGGRFKDAYSYLAQAPRWRTVRWWQDRLVGLNDPTVSGGARLVGLTETGGGSALRGHGEFAWPAESNVTVPTNDGQRGIGLGEANGRLLIGLDASVWAYTQGPSPVSRSPDITLWPVGASGFVSPLAGALVPRHGSSWCWVARDGIWLTDGVDAERLTGRARTNIDDFWRDYVARGQLRAARARLVLDARRVDFLLPCKSRGATSAGVRMMLVAWHYDVDEFVVRGWAPEYTDESSAGYANATALGTYREAGIERTWHATSALDFALGDGPGMAYRDDVGHRDVDGAGDVSRIAMKMLSPRMRHGSSQAVAWRWANLLLNEAGAGVRVDFIVNPDNTRDPDALPAARVELAANVERIDGTVTPDWDGAGVAWDGPGVTWQPDREVARRAMVGDRVGEMGQLLIDATDAERVSLQGYEIGGQEKGRAVEERGASGG